MRFGGREEFFLRDPEALRDDFAFDLVSLLFFFNSRLTLNSGPSFSLDRFHNHFQSESMSNVSKGNHYGINVTKGNLKYFPYIPSILTKHFLFQMLLTQLAIAINLSLCFKLVF